jgi:hypothetical protein
MSLQRQNLGRGELMSAKGSSDRTIVSFSGAWCQILQSFDPQQRVNSCSFAYLATKGKAYAIILTPNESHVNICIFMAETSQTP